MLKYIDKNLISDKLIKDKIELKLNIIKKKESKYSILKTGYANMTIFFLNYLKCRLQEIKIPIK